MKKLVLFVLLGAGMTFGSLSHAQKNCIQVFHSGLQRTSDVIQIDARDTGAQAQNLESLHKLGYFRKEVREEVRDLSFGEKETRTIITYTITNSGKRHRRITNRDLVNEVWNFCK